MMAERLYTEDADTPNIQSRLFNGRLAWNNSDLEWMHLEKPAQGLCVAKVAVFECVQMELWDEL